MSADPRAAQLAVLESAAKAKPSARDFDRLLSSLNLSPACRSCLVEVIRQRRWTLDPEPFASVRRAVLACLTAEPEKARSWNWRKKEAIDSACPKAKKKLSEAVDRLYRSSDDPDPLIDRIDSRFIIEEAPPPDVAERCLDPIRKLDVDAIANAAGLDVWEATALRSMASGTGLRAALSQQRSDADRRHLRAAWMRLERKKNKLATVLQKLKPCDL